MTREEALRIVRKYNYVPEERAALETLIPELRESEDERIRKWLYDYIERVGRTWGKQPFHYEQILAWLERQKEQKPAEWSDEDEEMLQGCINSVEYELLDNGMDDEVKTDPKITWLKSLPLNLKKKNEDVAKLCFNEWSEEDEEMLKKMMTMFEFHNDKEEIWNWLCNKARRLKSLRPHWKPSEEQMNGFHTVLYQPQYISNSDDERLKQAESLYNDLKKLM